MIIPMWCGTNILVSSFVRTLLPADEGGDRDDFVSTACE